MGDLLAKAVSAKSSLPSHTILPNDWAALADPIDPYMWWLESTQYRALRRDGLQPIKFSFIAHGNSQALQAAVTRDLDANQVTVIVLGIYEQPFSNGKRPEFWTLQVDFSGFVKTLSAELDESAQQIQIGNKTREILIWLIEQPSIKRLQLGFPRGTGKVGNVPQPADGKRPQTSIQSTAKKEGKETAKVVIGVIDDGCAFAHDGLCSATSTRMAFVWSQTTFADSYGADTDWEIPRNFEYGRELTGRSLNHLIAKYTAGGEVRETDCYQRYYGVDKPVRGMLGRESHGAAMTMLAAGQLRNSDDEAGKAPVIFVDLPIEQAEISSGRWMPVNGLDAMRYIQSRARDSFRRKVKKEPLPVVINLSSGSSAGPHDGTSMLECAMDEMLKHDPHLAITLAAGNGRTAKSHVRKALSAKGECAVEFFVPPGKKWETYVEIWLPKNVDEKVLRALTFELIAPNGQSARVSLSNKAGTFIERINRKNEKIAGMLLRANVVQSIDRAMVLVAIAPTNIHPVYPYSPSGIWKVNVTSKRSSAQVELNCWIERDEVVFGARRPQMARFVSDEQTLVSRNQWAESATAATIRRDGTFSNIASGGYTFAVAAGTRDYENGFPSPYSGAPMLNEASPAFVAKADRSPAQPGILVSGNYRGARRHINGTSVAAPQAARWIANEMAEGRTRLDIAKFVTSKRKLPARLHPNTGVAAPNDGVVFVTPGIQTVSPP